jgi:hypothetical protein
MENPYDFNHFLADLEVNGIRKPMEQSPADTFSDFGKLKEEFARSAV